MADTSSLSNEELLAALQQHLGGEEKPPAEYSTFGGLTDRAVNSMTMGFSDEITSAAIATVMAPFTNKTWKQEYSDEMNRQSAVRNQTSKDAPVSSFVADVTGGLASPVLSIGTQAVRGATDVANAMYQGGKAGAAYGAITGFGSAENGLGNRVRGAVGGAVVGGALGAATPAVVQGGIGAYRAANALMGRSNPETVATNHVARAIDRSGMSADDIARGVQEGADSGVPILPVDTSPSMRRLGRSVETVPGRASDAATRLLDERQSGQVDRVSSQLRRAVGNDGDLYGTAEQIIAKRAEEAKPLYEEAYKAQIWDDNLAALLKRPAMRRAFGRAKVIAANEGVNPNTFGITGFNAAGDPIIGDIPSMRTWDYIKRGLDDQIERYRNPVTGKLQVDEAGRALVKLRAEFLGELTKNPAAAPYAAARGSFAGHTEMLDALSVGRDFLKGDIENVANRFNAMSPAEQELFRIGAIRELRGTIAKSPDGADIVKRIFGSPEKRNRLQLLFSDPEQFQAFSRIMDLEREATKTHRFVTGGSPTGRIAAEQDDGLIGTVVSDAIQGGSLKQSLGRYGVKMLSKARGINEESAGKIAAYIFNPDPDAIRRAAQEADISAILAQNAKVRGVTRQAGNAAAVASSAAFAPR